MKITTFLLALFLIVINLQAQETETNDRGAKIGVTFSSFGSNDIIADYLIGAASYSGDGFYSIGFTYIKPLNKWLDLETGIDWSEHEIKIDFNLFLADPTDPLLQPNTQHLSLLNIPITLRANFLRYFYANGGMLIGMDISKRSPIDTQGGMGAIIGLGAKYDFKCGASIFLNPYTKFHALIGFNNDKYRKQIIESGIKLGLVFGK